MNDIEQLTAKALAEIEAATDLEYLEQLRVHYLGKKGQLKQHLKQLGSLPDTEKPKIGNIVNRAKNAIEAALSIHKDILGNAHSNKLIRQGFIDTTLPACGWKRAGLHPVTLTLQRIESLFCDLGFDVVDGPEIENDYYNFEALNVPEYHPARAMHDTFYMSNGYLLRTHTSSVQIRTMENGSPPFRFISPGRVYRRDLDLTHTPMFHQVEGVVIDKSVTFSMLKGLVTSFLQDFFQQDLKIRFRPSYFPFTEPSAEVDIMGEQGWLEVLGCGMVHPKVLQNVGIDLEEYTGFAFGMGVERLAMLSYGINDLRLFFDNNLDFLEQFQ